jgi:hypothetical protein
LGFIRSRNVVLDYQVWLDKYSLSLVTSNMSTDTDLDVKTRTLRKDQNTFYDRSFPSCTFVKLTFHCVLSVDDKIDAGHRIL